MNRPTDRLKLSHCETWDFGSNIGSPPKQAPARLDGDCFGVVFPHRRRLKPRNDVKTGAPFSLFPSTRQAFTLAEVLITLGIIGVVAAMTIPTLMSNQQKQSTTERLKKTYSSLTQTTNYAVIDNGPVETWFTPEMLVAGSGAQLFAETFLTPYMNVAKNCGLSSVGDCSKRINYLTPSQGYTDALNLNHYKFYLTDGTLISVSSYTGSRISIYVDINGQAKPNTMGKDVFLFFYYPSGKFKPEGASWTRVSILNDNAWGCNKNGGRGTTCTGLIMLDGWQIKDDYPWN